MRNGMKKDSKKTKKGITMVELIVAMTLTAIFAVVCVSLILPISTLYQGIVKLSKAQLLADTVVDSIRRECDEVKFDEENSVWIANLTKYNNTDDSDLLNRDPGLMKVSDATASNPGNALIIRKNNNYTGSIYSCVPITSTNYTNVINNPVKKDATGKKTIGDSIATLIVDTDSVPSVVSRKGVVHFGYYQSKEDDDGIFPFRAYDYTNPVLNSTYDNDNLSVKLEFFNLVKKDGKYPAYVNCKVSVYEGKDYDSAENGVKGPIYSRTTVLSFNANGSGEGSGGSTPAPSNKKNVRITVIWDDNNNAQGLRPTNGIKILLKNSTGSSVLRSRVISSVTSTEPQVFVFANVDSADGFTVSQVKNSAGEPEQIEDYDTIVTPTADGFIIKNIVSTRPDVWLIKGSDFNSLIGKDVTGIVFGSESALSNYTSGLTAQPVALPLNATSGRIDEYKLYKNQTTHQVYVTSFDGKFVANSDCAGMFKDCKNLASITWTDESNENRVVIDTQYTTTMFEMFLHCGSLTQLNLRGFVKGDCHSTEKMFQGCSSISFIDLRDWNTSGVTTMNRMFCNFGTRNAENPVTVDLSSFSFEKCKIISKLFYRDYDGKEGLSDKSIVLYVNEVRFPEGYKNLRNVTTMDAMFSQSNGIQAITNINNMDCQSLTDARNAFFGCSALVTLDLSNLKMPICPNDAANPTNTDKNKIYRMFNGCTSLTSINLDGWDIRKVTTLQDVFGGDKKLKTITMNDCTIGDNISLFGAFNGFDQLETIEMRGFNWGAVTNLNNTFKNCKKLTSIDTTFGDDALSKCKNTEGSFYACYVLNGIDLSKAKLLQSTTTKDMFHDCKALTSVSLGDLHAANKTDCSAMFQNCTLLETVNIDFANASYSVCESTARMFYSCERLTGVDFSNVTFAKTMDTHEMFYGCKNATTINVANFTAPLNTNCSGMFCNCYVVSSLDFSGWSTANVTSMSSMFSGCRVINTLDLSTFNTQNVQTMACMFKECFELSALDFASWSDWNTSNVEKMNEMFYGCKRITTLNLGMFVTSKVDTMQGMFRDCYALQGIDFSSSGWNDWDTSKVTDMSYMFYNCCYLTSGATTKGLYDINISNFEFNSVTLFTSMFDGSTDKRDLTKKIVLPKAGLGNPVANGVTDARYMFRKRMSCTEIENLGELTMGSALIYARSMFSKTNTEVLDVRNIDFSNLKFSNDNADEDNNGSAWIFDTCSRLKTIITKDGTDYTNAAFTGNQMFKSSNKLVGGNGTKNTGNNYGKVYAVVDGYQNKSGYFTSVSQWEAQGH